MLSCWYNHCNVLSYLLSSSVAEVDVNFTARHQLPPLLHIAVSNIVARSLSVSLCVSLYVTVCLSVCLVDGLASLRSTLLT